MTKYFSFLLGVGTEGGVILFSFGGEGEGNSQRWGAGDGGK